jgi:hypothetical protein
MSEALEAKLKKCNDQVRRALSRKRNVQKQLAEVRLQEQCEYSFALFTESIELQEQNKKLKAENKMLKIQKKRE